MSKTQVLLVVLGASIGVAATSLFVGAGARAQTGFSACGYLTIPGNGGSMGGQPPAQTVSIPAGWTPVGGANFRGGIAGVVVCH